MIKMICQVNISYISLNWGKKKLKITFPRRDLGGACFTSTIGKAATTQTGFNKNQSTTTNVFPGDSEPPKQLHTHQMCEKHSTPKCVSVRQLFNGCSPPNKFWFNENKQKKTHAIYGISGATVTTDPPHVQNTSTCFPSACSTPGNDGKTDLIRQKKLAGHFGEAAWLSYPFSLLRTLLV